jgi:FkbM family methyltransferase
MTFISYAQNYEDVMLWRALKHVGRGFYIDAGAWSPDVDSVTKAFYENGWRGINIEPNPGCHAQLEKKRPHDANLCVAVGDAPGFAELNLLSDSGLSTLDDAIARSHVAAGWDLEKIMVQVTTLAEIWKEHVPAKQEVHFLKIDVEGFEERALRGNDWEQCRPWIVVVEATLPDQETELYESWEPILLNADYAFAYADGLNRFYVAREHDELLSVFQYPPNYFDHFRPHALVVAEAKAQDAESRVRQVETRTQWLQNQWNAMQARLETLAGQESAAKAEAARLEAQLREKSEELTATQQALVEQQRQWSALRNERSEAQARIAQLDRSLQHWRSTAEDLDRQILEDHRAVQTCRPVRPPVFVPVSECDAEARDRRRVASSVAPAGSHAGGLPAPAHERLDQTAPRTLSQALGAPRPSGPRRGSFHRTDGIKRNGRKGFCWTEILASLETQQRVACTKG